MNTVMSPLSLLYVHSLYHVKGVASRLVLSLSEHYSLFLVDVKKKEKPSASPFGFFEMSSIYFVIVNFPLAAAKGGRVKL